MKQSNLNIDFYEIIERVTDAFFALDKEWNFTYINQKGAEILGREADDLIGKNVWAEFPKGLKSKFFPMYHQAMKEQKMVEFDEYYVEPLHKWLHVRAYPSDSGLSVFFKDITKDYLQQKIDEEHFNSLFKENPDGVFSMDINGYITNVNPSFEELSGYPIGYFIGRKFSHLPTNLEEDIHYIESKFEKAKTGQNVTFDYSLKHRDGHIIETATTYFPIKFHGEIIGIFGVLKDVTEIKKMETILRKSEQKYRSLKLHNPNGICSFDLNGHLIGVNPAFEKMTGYKENELLNMDIKDLLSTKDYENVKDMIYSNLKHKRNVDTIEAKINNKYNKVIYAQITLIPIYIDQKQEGFYLIIKDITKAKQTEELLLQSEKLNAVGQLAASIVHEIRNPLTSLMGFLQLMRNNSSVNEEYYQIMSDELSRINSIASELLVLAKPQETKAELTDIRDCISDVATLMKSQASLNNIELKLQYPDKLPAIYCDIQQLKQAFINIIKNGLEAMENNSGGEFSITALQENDHIIISFKDQGVGISADHIKKLGEPFYTTKEKGTGLGMMMIKSVIKNHHGEIKIESEPGKGTTVNVILPTTIQH